MNIINNTTLINIHNFPQTQVERVAKEEPEVVNDSTTQVIEEADEVLGQLVDTKV